MKLFFFTSDTFPKQGFLPQGHCYFPLFMLGMKLFFLSFDTSPKQVIAIPEIIRPIISAVVGWSV